MKHVKPAPFTKRDLRPQLKVNVLLQDQIATQVHRARWQIEAVYEATALRIVSESLFGPDYIEHRGYLQ